MNTNCPDCGVHRGQTDSPLPQSIQHSNRNEGAGKAKAVKKNKKQKSCHQHASGRKEWTGKASEQVSPNQSAPQFHPQTENTEKTKLS